MALVDGSSRTRRTLRTTALLLGLALVASGCLYFPAAVQHEQNMPDTRPWWCHSTGDGGHGHHGEHDPYEGVEKGMLSWDDCRAVSAQFDLAIDYVTQWPTAGDAEGDGWHQMVSYAAGMGTHHVRTGGLTAEWINSPEFDPDDPTFPGTDLDERFDPTRPEYLMYDGNGPNAELTGMAWWVKTTDGQPPDGFRGDNDWWHQHPLVCINRTTVTYMGENRTDAECESLGGINVDFSDWWMTHAWILPDWQVHFDVFVNHHPCIAGGGPITDPDHECWDEAHSGAGHGDH